MKKYKIVLLAIIVLIGGLLNLNFAKAVGASLYLSPSTGTKVLNSTFSVSVRVNTDGAAINAAEGSVSYDSSKLSVVGISKGGSIFNLWTQDPKDSGGSISFGGGIPMPGYNGSAGTIFSITFKTKNTGAAAVRFTSGAVLANDGKGTNILASMGSASFTVSPKVSAPSTSDRDNRSKPEPAVVRLKPDIVSLTHPDQNKWYSNRDVDFSWELPSGVNGVSILFNDKSQSDPGPSSDGKFDSKKYSSVDDGVWYLHLKFKDSRGWGTIAHYKVQIDGSVPSKCHIEVKQDDPNDWPTLYFEASDELSGLSIMLAKIGSLEEKAYDIKPEEPFLKVSGLEVGKHTVIVKALDKAGNETYCESEFYIKAIEAPTIENYPKEMKSSDQFFASGKSVKKSTIKLFIKKDSGLITKEIKSDEEGKWFVVLDDKLENGRYLVWAESVNENGIKSETSNKVSFLVSPPIFARVGDFVINYFTVFASIIFISLLIVILIIYIVRLARKKLRKETREVEDVVKVNIKSLEKEIDADLAGLNKLRTASDKKKEGERIREELKEKVNNIEKKILKEIKDVEDILD